MSDYEHVIWLPGWCFWFIPVLWFVIGAVLAGFFMRNQPDYGPADQLVASAGPTFVAMILSAMIVLGLTYLLGLAGLEFGFRS
jgi:hypothetical protein